MREELGSRLDQLSTHLSKRLSRLEHLLQILRNDHHQLLRTRDASNSVTTEPRIKYEIKDHDLIKSWPAIHDMLRKLNSDENEKRVVCATKHDLSPMPKVCAGPQTSPIPAADADIPLTSCVRSDLDGYLRNSTTERLIRSYVRHIHIMHPILDLTFLEDAYDRLECKAASKHHLGKRKEMATSSTPDSPRKYLKTGEDCDSRVHVSDSSIGSDAGLTLQNVLVLLMLALGEVCETKETHDVTRNKATHSPGQSYYDKAMETFGRYLDWTSLLHAQIYILAGLYKGQLARPSESLHLYHLAGRMCHNLLSKNDLIREDYCTHEDEVQLIARKRQLWITDPAHDFIILTSWTCLQLESEVRVGLLLPPGALEIYQDKIPWPLHIPGQAAFESLSRTCCPRETGLSSYTMLLNYTAQMWLRKLLNRIQRQIYEGEYHYLNQERLRSIIRDHQHALRLWRSSLPDALCWGDDDVPPTNIFAARLRATYWTACFLVNRPMLDYMIHVMPTVKEKSNIQSITSHAWAAPRKPPEIELFNAIFDMPKDEIDQAVESCLKATIYSILAFDGISGVPIVPNLGSTVRTQFESMLVLSAASLHSAVQRLLPQFDLESLFGRVIRFMEFGEFFSQAYKVECEILRKLKASHSSAHSGVVR